MDNISTSENVQTPDENDTRPIESTPTENTARSSTNGGSIVSTPIVPLKAQSGQDTEDSKVKYVTSYPKRGIALVINQEEFVVKDLQRSGSNKDRDDISSALTALEFDVRVENNLKRKELLAMLTSVAKEDHSQNDCLVVVVMTHGAKDALYAFDYYYPVSRLWEPFVGDACPSLLGKPKLFFIQACRGTTVDDGVKLSKVVPDAVDSQSSSKQLSDVVPTMADLLVMYSTYDGHFSYRNSTTGSWFIQSLSEVLNENVPNKPEVPEENVPKKPEVLKENDPKKPEVLKENVPNKPKVLEKNVPKKPKELLQLLTVVSRKVAKKQSYVPDEPEKHAKKQISCIVSTLTKELYFPLK